MSAPGGPRPLSFAVLGPLVVRGGADEIPIRAPRRRELLVALLLHCGEVLSQDRLVDALWGDEPPRTATKALQVHVSQLRRELGDTAGEVLVTRPPGYVLDVDRQAVDALRFERLAGEGAAASSAGDHARASASLREALALWRGPPLADMRYADFAQPQIARLEELRLDVIEARVASDLAGGRTDLCAEIEGLVREHPLRERLRAHHMVALYRAGRQAEALAAYRAARHDLMEELGIEPSPALRALEQAVLRQDPSLLGPEPETSSPTEAFVGREAELASLLRRLDAAAEGRGGAVIVAGEAGIGKTRLTEELSRRTTARGALVLRGRCWEAGGAPPYWPWLQVLRAYVRQCPPELLRATVPAHAHELAALVPELRAVVDGDAPTGGDPKEARFRLFDAVFALLRAAAAARPLLVVLDDLHASDAPSLLLLEFVAGQLGDARLLMVGTYRTEEVHPGDLVAGFLAELARAPATDRLDLVGLPPGDVERLLALTTARAPAPGLVTAIHEETEGNPLFVSEVARLLGAEGRLEGVATDATWRERLPPGVHDAIGRRLHRLSAECRELLMHAAVLGREFSVEPVGRLTASDPGRALDVLDEAVAAQVVGQAGGPGRLRFSHALVRDVLYAELTPARRARAHRRAGEVLAELYAAEVEPHLAELAHHFCLGVTAGAGEEALAYAERAGERAARQLAFEEAGRLFALALSVLDRTTVEPATRCRVVLRLGDAQVRGGDGAGARETFLRAAAIARGAGLAEQLAEAALAYSGRFLWMRSASDPDLVPLFEEALAALGAVDHPLRAKLTARLLPALRGEVGWERRTALGDAALAMARRLDDPATLGYVLDACSCGLEGPETLERTLADAGEIMAIGQALGDDERVYNAAEHRLWAAWTLGDMATVDSEYDRMAALSARLQQPAQRWLVGVVETVRATFEGRLAEAEELVERTMHTGERAQIWSPAVVHHIQTFTLRSEQGRLADLAPVVLAFGRDRPTYGILRCLIPPVRVASGEGAAAAAAIAELAPDRFAAISQDETWLWGVCLLAEACAVAGDDDHAATLYELLRPHGHLVAVSPPEAACGSVARRLGLLASRLHDHQQAVAHFAQALALDERTGARPSAAHDRHAWGRTLLLHGDRGEGRALLREAATGFTALGMDAWARTADSEARAVASPA